MAGDSNTQEPLDSDGLWQPPTPEELGVLLPQYRIDALLGGSGMGAVYKAYETGLLRFVSIKLSPASFSRDAVFVETFIREAQLLAKLNHPRIVDIYDRGETKEGHLYYVRQFVEGENLRSLLDEGPLERGRALMLTSQICDALHALHGKEIVHRDIKPESFVVDAEGNAKLVEFGNAAPTRARDAAAIHALMVNTPAYSAPELMDEPGDHRADIFALGVLFYEMLTGTPPSGDYEPVAARVNGGARLDEVIIRALQPDREDRFQSANEFKEIVDSIRGVAGLKPLVPSAPRPRVVIVEQKRSGSFGKVLVMLALLAAAAWFFTRNKERPAEVAAAPTTQGTVPLPAEEKPAPPKDDAPPAPVAPGPTVTPAMVPEPIPSTATNERKTIERIEGERMDIVKVTGGKAEPDDMTKNRGAVWSGTQHLEWKKATKDDVLTVKFAVSEGGLQRVKAVLTAAKDFGIVDVRLDGRQVAGSPFNQVARHTTILGTLDFGVFDLAKGDHQFDFTMMDSEGEDDSDARTYVFGLDYIQLEPPTRNEPPAKPGTDVARTAKPSASKCEGLDTVTAMNDGKELPPPQQHDDKKFPRHTWFPRNGGMEWAQYEWETPQVVNECLIYWYDDRGPRKGCDVPVFWRILYRDEGGAWLPVEASFPDAEVDKWSAAKFPPVKTTALRLVVQCYTDCSAGVYAWKVFAADPENAAEVKPRALPDLRLSSVAPLRAKPGQGVYASNIYSNNEKGDRVVRLGGKECTDFLWAHAACRIDFAIPEGYDRFKATGIMPTKSSGERSPRFGQLKFAVEVDGKTLIQSPELHTIPNLEFPVDLKLPAGSKTLTLVTDDLGDRNLDHAFWAHSTLLGGISSSITDSQWYLKSELNQRPLGDLTFRGREYSIGNGIAGEWRATGPRTVELGTAYALQFAENFESFVAASKDGAKVATGTRKSARLAVPNSVAVGFKPIYETGFELPVFTQGAFQTGRAQAVCRTDLRWGLVNVGTSQIGSFAAGVGAQFFKTGRQALWVNAKVANANLCGFSAVVENAGGSILVEADVYLASSPKKTGWQFAVGDADLPEQYVGGFYADAEGRGIQLITKARTFVLEPIKRDTWVRVQLRVDTQTQSFSVFFDGKEVASKIPVFSVAQRVRTFQFATTGSGDDRAFFDNFSFAVSQ